MALTMQEQIELLTPLFEPVVEDIQEIKENTEATKIETEEMNAQLEAIKQEEAQDPAPAAETETTESKTMSIQSTETSDQEITLDPVEVTPEETEVASETETPDPNQLILEELQIQNTHLESLLEQQQAQSELITEGSFYLIFTVVIALGIKTWVEQVIKW